MRATALLTIVLILALSAVGCEREDLHYPAPAPSPVSGDTTQKGTEPVDTSQSTPPLDEGKARELAARTAGQWRGTLSTKYIDYRGVTITNSCLSEMIFMLDDTIRNNVAFGVAPEEQDEARIWEALKEAALDDFVRGLPDGLDTGIGERGIRISGGSSSMQQIPAPMVRICRIKVMIFKKKAQHDTLSCFRRSSD